MKSQISRRQFLHRSSLATTAFWIGSSGWMRGNSPNGKLNIGVIGTANRAAANIKGVESQNIVALCDIDDNFLSAASLKFPQAKKYNDFRKMLEQKNIDAVVVAATDHTHAIATVMALNSGRHVYCEKPLAHDVHEARIISRTAAKHKKLATQMGTQIHAGNNYRRVVELVQTGAVGQIKEVHVWCAKSKPGTVIVASDTPPIPKNLHWDLWLGPAPEHSYHPNFHPQNWRVYWDYGCGCMGDMACHYMDLAFWALKLRAPLTVEAEGPPAHPIVTPGWMIVHWEFPARGDLPPVKATWYDGGKRPAWVEENGFDWPNGVLFVGDKGMLWADYTAYKLLPEDRFKDFKKPTPFIPDSIGHHNEWIDACKTGKPTTCNFDYAGVLSEAVLLGNVAFRTGQKLEWDAAACRVKNVSEANNFVQREYRKGWAL